MVCAARLDSRFDADFQGRRDARGHAPGLPFDGSGRARGGYSELGRGGGALAQPYNSGQTPYTNWITTLQQSGYTVTQGAENNFPGCQYFIASFDSCFGKNTATPYVLTQPPVTYPNNLPTYAYLAGSGFTGSAPGNPPNERLTDDLWEI
jgi:hypothetical protein